MSPSEMPKVVLFDIGGVCVLSPMQGVLDYERKNGIPDSWINYAIRHSSPNGHWQRLERGEIALDADFFKGFTTDLQNQDAWRQFNNSFRNGKGKLKDVANPTQLGDHVSLKAEGADSRPTDQDRGSGPVQNLRSALPNGSKDEENASRPSLSKLAKDTTIGDPTSLESEDVVESSQSSRAPPSHSPSPSSSNSPSASTGPSKPATATPSTPPSINGETLFWTMMEASRHPDPYIFPALERLTKLPSRPIIAALSNTINWPPNHPWNPLSNPKSAPQKTSSTSPAPPPPPPPTLNPAALFDIYIASADVGMRKPSRDIYDLTLQRINEHQHTTKQTNGKSTAATEEIKPADIVFLDDIGENLKTAREMGMQTIRVQMGKTWRAVKELEGILGGVELMDEKTRRSKL